jgi:hypothetical protein
MSLYEEGLFTVRISRYARCLVRFESLVSVLLSTAVIPLCFDIRCLEHKRKASWDAFMPG